MAEKTAEKEKPASKLILFNHSKNPYHLGLGADGKPRLFKVGESMECKDQKEYDMLRGYKGVSTTQQVAPGLQAHVQSLQDQIAALTEERDDQKKRLEKFESKGK